MKAIHQIICIDEHIVTLVFTIIFGVKIVQISINNLSLIDAGRLIVGPGEASTSDSIQVLITAQERI